MKLAILSDTHGLLRPEVTEHLKAADASLHGGDINRQSIVDELRQYAPLYIVRGNNDKDWAEAIPHDLTVTLGGVTFFMVHNRKEVPADLAGVDAVVFGHSHKYVQEEKGGVLWLNPGSCGPRRFHQEITMMTAEAEENSYAGRQSCRECMCPGSMRPLTMKMAPLLPFDLRKREFPQGSAKSW